MSKQREPALRSRAGRELTPWRTGCLFHNFSRYPRKPGARRVDRLAGILQRGIVPPGLCSDGAVCSDLNLIVTGLSTPYDSLVFLHRFGPDSYIYTISEPGRFAVFVDPQIPVLTQEDLGPDWLVLCQDEVYVQGAIAIEKIIGIAAHEQDIESVMTEFQADLKRLRIPLFTYDGVAVA